MNSTIYDVSRLSGVSIATVSRAFSDPDKVRESTRKKVYEAAETLHYTPNAIARALTRQKNNKIAYVICKKDATILDEFYAAICEGIMFRLKETDYQLLISPEDDWTSIEKSLGSRQVDGVILAGDARPEMLTSLQTQGVAAVLVNNAMPAFRVPAVVSDERGGVHQAVEALTAQGCTKVGLLMGRFFPYVSIERYQGFLEAAKELGLTVPNNYIRMCELNVESATQAASELLRQEDRPEAVVTGNDVLAAGVLKAAARLGIRIPAELKVIGIDDSAMCTMLEPELASVHVDCHKMGMLSAELLQSAIDGETELPGILAVPETLVMRISAGENLPEQMRSDER